MQYCSKEAIAWLFYNASNSLKLLFIFFYFTSIFLTNILAFFGGNLFFTRNNDGFEYVGTFSDEELEDESSKYNVEFMQQEEDQHVGKIFDQSEKTDFLNSENSNQDEDDEDDDEIPLSSKNDDDVPFDDEDDIEESYVNSEEEEEEEKEEEEEGGGSDNTTTSPDFESMPTDNDDDDEVIKEEILERYADSPYDRDANDFDPTSTRILTNNNNHLLMGNVKCVDGSTRLIKEEKEEDDFHVFAPSNVEDNKKIEKEDIFGDSCTVGSTSKSSSDWRSSIYNKDYTTEDPFSSSSRRSCPKWESYTVFQKYDEEMLFLDRISAQKLQETESLRSIQACPRSISGRIAHKFANPKFHPYQELEVAYVAQICLTWEALNWNYNFFQTLRAARREQDPGCPAYVAQQFQQFLVLLQRYVENEPYEHGRRPEVYARTRRFAPKLLQVPEYRDSDEEKEEEGSLSRISSNSFVLIMEEAIRTFMDFLKADKKTGCQILADFFRRKPKFSVDPTFFFLLNKINKKKKKKLKELGRRSAGNCLIRKRKLKHGEEMKILMGIIDLKVVSRVLRMKEGLNEEQMQWCESKMSKVKVSNGKLHRDSSPLFFPAH